MAGKFNGHKNWNHWNVSLWLFNDASLYGLVVDSVRRCRTLDDAAVMILDILDSLEATHTPDGGRYTKTAIRSALVGFSIK